MVYARFSFSLSKGKNHSPLGKISLLKPKEKGNLKEWKRRTSKVRRSRDARKA
jgi:hypothetical protein